MRDVLDKLERWVDEGLRVATATVIRTERSAPREPGAVLAVSERGEVAGSVTGGCVEPAVYEEAREVLAGGAPRLRAYGIADEEAFEVGLPCGGTVHIFVDALDAQLVTPIAVEVRAERPIALAITPLLKVALGTPAAYIGAMGSRRTTRERAALLREEGVPEAELVRVHAPIGLDLGARTPQEVAVAVAAELIAVTRGRLPDAVSLREAIAG